MKWNQLTVFISFALQQVSAIETYAKPFAEYSSINNDVENVNKIETSEIILINKPMYRSFSSLYGSDSFHGPRKMKKVIKMNVKEEEDFDLANPLQKRLNEHTGAIVPHKSAGAIVPHKGGNGGHAGPAPRKGIGKGVKIAAGVGGVVALGGAAYAGAKALVKHNKNKQSHGGPQLVKRARGGKRKRIAAQNRANEAKAQASTPPTKPEKSGMGNKTKAGLLVGAGVAAGAGAMAMTGGGGGNQNPAPAAK